MPAAAPTCEGAKVTLAGGRLHWGGSACLGPAGGGHHQDRKRVTSGLQVPSLSPIL